MRYEAKLQPDSDHLRADELVKTMQELGAAGHLHLVKSAVGSIVVELHANEIAYARLKQVGVSVEVDKNLHTPYAYQVKLNPAFGDDSKDSLKGILKNTTNFNLAIEPALSLDSEHVAQGRATHALQTKTSATVTR